MAHRFTCYEFFAGAGMARLGLGAHWKCVFANEICSKKAATYQINFPPACGLAVQDVATLRVSNLPGRADLAWASFPCQDLSLAGNGAGLNGDRSGTFWPFWKLLKGLRREERAPRIVALENVVGAVTSHSGEDFAGIFEALVSAGYIVGPMVVDGALFVPQSRPRLFIVAIDSRLQIPAGLASTEPGSLWHRKSLREAHSRLSPSSRSKWIWWSMPSPPPLSTSVVDLIENEPGSVTWHSAEKTQRLLEQMTDLNLAKVRLAQNSGKREIGFVYRRTRPDGLGRRQRAEVRFDGVSGCLRTPVGGSSRQIVLVVENSRVRSRLLAPREAARLMGIPESYRLPENYNEAYHVAGDGVVVPLVRHMAAQLFEPILVQIARMDNAA